MGLTIGLQQTPSVALWQGSTESLSKILLYTSSCARQILALSLILMGTYKALGTDTSTLLVENLMLREEKSLAQECTAK